MSSRFSPLPKLSLGAVAFARFASVLIFSLGAIGLGATFVLKNINDAVINTKRDDAVSYFQARSKSMDAIWLGVADVFRVQLEFSRILDSNDLRLVRARLTAYVESVGGSNVFSQVVLIGPKGDVIARYRAGSERDIAIPASLAMKGAGPPVWTFDEASRTIYKVFGVPILVNGARCRLLMYTPLDSATLTRITFPSAVLALVWQGQPVARSVQESSAPQMKNRHEIEIFASIPWGTDAEPVPLLEIRRSVRLPVSALDVGLFMLAAGVLIVLLSWLMLGRWLRTTIARILVLEHATNVFVGEGMLTSEIDAKLTAAGAAGNDEISSLALEFGSMMREVSKKTMELRTHVAELGESEERFQRAFNLTPMPHSLISMATGRLLEFSDQAQIYFGCSREQAIGRTALELGFWEFPEDRARFLEIVSRDNGTRNFPVTLRKDGGKIGRALMSADIISIRGEDCILIAIFDLSDVENAQARMAESDAKFRTIFELSPVPFTLSILATGRVLEISDQALLELGVAREQVIGTRADELLAWESPEARARFVGLLTENKRVRHYSATFRKPSGDHVSVLLSADVITVNGELCVLSATLDITELKKTRQELADIEERYRVIVDAMAEGVVLHASDGSIVELNQAAAGLLGATEAQLRGKQTLDPARQILDEHGNVLSEAMFPSSIAIRTGRRVPTTMLQVRHPDRRLTWIEVTALPLAITSIGGTGVLVTISDRSAEVVAEEALRDLTVTLEHRVASRTRELAVANEELEAFSYSVSHDLRAPLRGMEGFSRLLLERHASSLNAEAQGYLDRISKGTQRMGAIIDDLLTLARIARVHLFKTHVDLTALARAVANEMELDESVQNVEWQIEPGLTAVGDAGLLRIILENLLGNAVKYSAKSAVPVIRFYKSYDSGSDVEFAVSDNGAGFDNIYVGQLFTPFRRLHSTHEFAGTGVGLATVKRIVDRHNGSVRATGEVGKGATIWFRLPKQVGVGA